MLNVSEIIKQMSLKDKVSLCTGADFWNTKSYEKYNIPSIKMSDGPHGLRCQESAADMIGINESIPATCFPTAVTSGATWNKNLLYEEGKAIGQEALVAGVDVVLGPGCNIKRNPLCGRNFEYFSEDPVVSGEMAAAFISGQQSTGVSSSLKHFAVNNQEYKRQNGDSIIDERALREIYLKPFEIAVKKSQPGTVMCSYNKINGIHASDNSFLLNEVLRQEWDFNGLVVTDWGAMNNKIEAFKAGCDLNMPGGSKYMEKAVIEAVEEGILTEENINQSIERILTLIDNSLITKSQNKNFTYNQKEHNNLALEIAQQGAVLLKNEGNILPAKTEDMILIGYMAKEFRYQGAGSSHINPTEYINLCDALPEVPYIPCGNKNGEVNEDEIKAAVNAAKNAKVPVIVAGLPESFESEGFDREHMRIPQEYNKLIAEVSKENPNTVVVLLGGSPMELPWEEGVNAILYMGLPGQMGGVACANLLTGKANPGGKLTETWPISYEDVITKNLFGKKNTEYRESIFVGYRYYDSANKNVKYPFGFGLSYTTFEFSNLQIQNNKVTANIKNTGHTKGDEVIQLYVSCSNSKTYMPKKELKDFTKISLEPGETKTISFEIDDSWFTIWQNDIGWIKQNGDYKILLGNSSRNILLQENIKVEDGLNVPELNKTNNWYYTLKGSPNKNDFEEILGRELPEVKEPVKGEFTMDNTCLEMKNYSIAMKIQYKVTERVIAKGLGIKPDYSNPTFKMMMICAVDCPMRSVIISSGGMMGENIGQGLLEFANGHFFTGLRKIIFKK